MAQLKGNLDRMAATTSETIPIVRGPKGSDETVIVIGAGAAGLAAADALGRRGMAAVVLDKEQRIAEPWRRRHEKLTLNTHHASRAVGPARSCLSVAHRRLSEQGCHRRLSQ
jgi:2-polyprenyl-6-methoxyphenol hydroxylase-like FAD-dependent oxidoreductase